MKSALGLILFTSLALVLACGGSSPNDSVPTATAGVSPSPQESATAVLPSPTAQAATADCSPARAHDSGDVTATITSGAREREYLLHVPAGYTGSDALALVINLHGYGSSDREQATYSGFPAKADAEGFIVASPQGSGDPAGWNAFGLAVLPDDVAFISDLIDEIEATLCVEPARVYATGISNGAAMTTRLGCDLADRIAAIATVAGTSFPRDCNPGRPLPLIAFHGTADQLVPYNGGPIGAGFGERLGLAAPPVEDAVASWANEDGCATPPETEQLATHVRRSSYGTCGADADVDFYSIDGGGHTWPGAAISVARLGETTLEISATDLIWEFFSAHPRP